MSIDEILEMIKVVQRETWKDMSIAKLALGISEEVGELHHSILKASSGVEEFDIDEVGEECVDIIFTVAHLASILKIDLCDQAHKKFNKIVDRIQDGQYDKKFEEVSIEE